MTSISIGRVHIAVAACLMAGISANAFGGVWIEMSRHDNYAAYADPSTIRRDGDNVKMWSLLDYKRPQAGPDGKPYLSARRYFEYNCKQSRARSLGASLHALKEGNGPALASTDTKLGWSKVETDSADEFLFKLACKKETGQATIYGK
jgi:hypothetical protein